MVLFFCLHIPTSTAVEPENLHVTGFFVKCEHSFLLTTICEKYIQPFSSKLIYNIVIVYFTAIMVSINLLLPGKDLPVYRVFVKEPDILTHLLTLFQYPYRYIRYK